MIFLLEPSPIIALSCQSASPLVEFVAFIKFTQSPLVLAIIKSVSFQELIEFKEVNACSKPETASRSCKHDSVTVATWICQFFTWICQGCDMDYVLIQGAFFTASRVTQRWT